MVSSYWRYLQCPVWSHKLTLSERDWSSLASNREESETVDSVWEVQDSLRKSRKSVIWWIIKKKNILILHNYKYINTLFYYWWSPYHRRSQGYLFLYIYFTNKCTFPSFPLLNFQVFSRWTCTRLKQFSSFWQKNLAVLKNTEKKYDAGEYTELKKGKRKLKLKEQEIFVIISQ